jgi:hypothetical protein
MINILYLKNIIIMVIIYLIHSQIIKKTINNMVMIKYVKYYKINKNYR